MNIETIKSYAKEHKCKAEDLIALAPQNDPFYIQSASKISAEWIYKIWKKEGEPTKHPRGFHYRIMDKGYKMPNGKAYLNTEECWNFLQDGFKYARLLDLIPYEKVLDHQNPDAEETGYWEEHNEISYDSFNSGFQSFDEEDSEEEYIQNIIENKGSNFSIDYNSTLLQHFYIEIWGEKSNIIPRSVATQFDATIRPAGSGEFSLNMCYQALTTARRLGKPLFVFLLTDFDPKGNDMPKSVSRKIEYMAKQMDVTAFVKQISLTKEQCIKYQLPGVPAKIPKGEGTGAKAYRTHTKIFNNAMGRESTEINALMERNEEAYEDEIHQAISPYYDDEMKDKLREMSRDIEEQIEAEIKSVIESNKKKIIEVAKNLTNAEEELDNFIEQKKEELGIDGLRGEYNELTEIDSEKIIDSVDVEFPEAEYDAPKDVLLDTNRDYFEQIQVYKENDIRGKNA